MNDSLTKRDSISKSTRRRDGVSPTPWRKAMPNWNGRSIIWDAIGAIVTTDTRDADAALIVEAVNELARRREAVKAEVARRELGPAMIQELTDESRRLLAERDRLRELVRRLADTVRHDCDERAMAVTREAYAAIGEEVPE